MKPATSIEKVCRVLHTLRSQPSMGVKELADRAGLLRSDAHRILTSLEVFGYVGQDQETKKYFLGLELLKLGHFVYQHLDLREIARPFMRSLSELADATANLAILDSRDLEIVYVEQVDSPSELQIKMRIGARASPHATAVGKMLTAHQERSLARRILRKDGLVRKTRRTITDPVQLQLEYERIRSQDYAMDREEAVEGACCIAAPVRGHAGDVIAAMSISMMAARLSAVDEPRLITMVRTTAARISSALGFERADGAAFYRSPAARRAPGVGPRR